MEQCLHVCPINWGWRLCSFCASAGQTWKIACWVIFHDQEVLAILWNIVNVNNILIFLERCARILRCVHSFFFFFFLRHQQPLFLSKFEVLLYKPVSFGSATLHVDAKSVHVVCFILKYCVVQVPSSLFVQWHCLNVLSIVLRKTISLVRFSRLCVPVCQA